MTVFESTQVKTAGSKDEAFVRQRTLARVAGALAHELNNPIQGIQSLLGLLSHETETSEQGRIRLEQIRSGLARIARVVDHLTLFSENLPRVAVRIAVDEFIEQLTQEFRSRHFQAVINFADRTGTIVCHVPEITKLVAEILTCPYDTTQEIRLSARMINNRVEIICRSKEESVKEDKDWTALDSLSHAAGFPLLVDELTALDGGIAEFLFDDNCIRGIKLIYAHMRNITEGNDEQSN